MEICIFGTNRSNRIAGFSVKTDKVLQKHDRSKYDYKLTTKRHHSCDNRTVSTLFLIQPTDTVKRFIKDVKAKISTSCPTIMKQYDEYIGGVDTANALMDF